MRARLLLLAGVMALSACSGETTRPPNVLLISLDSTRRDLLSCYGRQPKYAPGLPTSPNLDRLAREGVVMEDAYATTSWTLPSHVSMMTGLTEVEHAVDQSVHRYGSTRPMLAERLQAEGFTTAGFFSGPFLEPRFGFGRGFDRYEACYGKELAAAATKAKRALEARDAAKARGDQEAFLRYYRTSEAAQAELQTASHFDVSSRDVTDGVLEELGRRADGKRPFFIFAHYFDPHYDYTAPTEYERYDPEYAGTLDASDFFNNRDIAGPATGPGPRVRKISDRDLDHVYALYEAELAWTDAQVGRILDKLDELGLAENTLVIVTSDHGDEFFEHGSIGHRRTLYEEVVQVPMILRLPRDEAGARPENERVSGLVSIADIPATVVDVIGVEGKAAEGNGATSFLPLVRGETDGAERSVLSRIVMSFGLSYRAPQGAPVEQVPGRTMHVIETYRRGSIKVTRKRSWPEVMMRIHPELDARWAEETRRKRSAETLTWIDVERHPDEPADAHSSDFSDPEARSVPRAFRDEYKTRLARREESRYVERDEGLQSMLKGLGYTAGDDPGAAPSDTLVLPPPGEGVLD